MSAEAVWKLFCATGAPEYYLLYRSLTGETSAEEAEAISA